MCSPGERDASARVPGPIASMRNPSSPGGAEHRLIGRGRTVSGGCNMKNWPGIPGSRPPRSTRSSVYGPTGSTATTLSAARFGMAFLKRQRVLAARVRDRVDRGLRTRERRDAGDARDERGLADEIAVAAGARALRRVDDEVALPAADEVDD